MDFFINQPIWPIFMKNDDESCVYVIYGCTNSDACNWDSEATDDDGSCIYPEMYYDCQGNCLNDTDQDGECDEVDFDDGIGIDELDKKKSGLIKMIDLLGREQKNQKEGQIILFFYDDGKIHKRVKL